MPGWYVNQAMTTCFQDLFKFTWAVWKLFELTSFAAISLPLGGILNYW
jgi:hypothetical protein